MKKFIFALLMCTCTLTNATVETGNSFLDLAEIHKDYAKNYLIGYVGGIYDAYEKIDPSIAICIGSEVRMTQLVDVLTIYLKNNPQIRQQSMLRIFPVAVKNAFKCKA